MSILESDAWLKKLPPANISYLTAFAIEVGCSFGPRIALRDSLASVQKSSGGQYETRAIDSAIGGFRQQVISMSAALSRFSSATEDLTLQPLHPDHPDVCITDYLRKVQQSLQEKQDQIVS